MASGLLDQPGDGIGQLLNARRGRHSVRLTTPYAPIRDGFSGGAEELDEPADFACLGTEDNASALFRDFHGVSLRLLPAPCRRLPRGPQRPPLGTRKGKVSEPS